jgi:hypothetical protein
MIILLNISVQNIYLNKITNTYPQLSELKHVDL